MGCFAANCRKNTLKGGSSAFPAWVKKILLNQCLNFLRSRKRQIPYDPQELPEINHAEINPKDPESNMIWELVQKLGPEHRKVIALRYLGDFSLEEIALELGIAPGTVKSRLHTAHERLRQGLNALERSE